MDNFNKILTGFLTLLVVVGVALYVFFRLGLLQKYVPALRTTQGDTQKSLQVVKLPTRTPTPTSKPTQKNNLLGWLFPQKTDPTPTAPNPPRLTPTTATTPSLKDAVAQSTGVALGTNTQVDTITIPYGSNTPTEFPATGASSLLLPSTMLVSALGLLLKHTKG